jgi:hypothetical protein
MYRANKDLSKGSATRFNMSKKKFEKYDEWMLFLEMAKQTGIDQEENARFGWADTKKPETKQTSITMKLEELDVGEILSVLNGVKDEVGVNGKGLFHKTPNGNTVLSFSKYVKEGKLLGYNLRISRKLNNDANAIAISQGVSVAEGEVLRVLLGAFAVKKFGWE